MCKTNGKEIWPSRSSSAPEIHVSWLYYGDIKIRDTFVYEYTPPTRGPKWRKIEFRLWVPCRESWHEWNKWNFSALQSWGHHRAPTCLQNATAHIISSGLNSQILSLILQSTRMVFPREAVKNSASICWVRAVMARVRLRFVLKTLDSFIQLSIPFNLRQLHQ